MKNKGFTLVELVITIAIVIILSVVSVPIFRGYTRNAKMTEGYALLGTILSAQKAYYSQHGGFFPDNQGSPKGLDVTANEEALGIDARGNKYFTFFCDSCDTSDGIYTYHFKSYVVIPEDLRVGKKSRICLFYDITSGSTLFEN